MNTSCNIHLLDICRICLSKTNESTNLFCNSTESLEILSKLSLCFQITLNSEKYLPSAICKTCINELDVANKFRIKCATIGERLKQYCETVTGLEVCHSSKVTGISKEAEAVAGQDFTEESQYILESDAQNSCESPAIPTTNANGYNKCNICDKVLKSIKSLEKHITRMHEKRRHPGKVTGYGSARCYHCTTCSYETRHSQTLVNHMRRHNGDRPFSCDCGKNFTQASSLAAHRKTHSNISNFTCSECGKQFKHAFSLKTHLRVHINGSFQCTVCLKLLKSKDSLHAHMKRHYKVYNYNCEDCGNTFVTSAELHNHRLKHSTVKAVVCHVCNFTTKTRKGLLAHLKRHEGDKAYKCNFCTKSFFTSADLRRHMRVHTREKPYSCQLCAQKFTYSTSLNKHMLNVHGVQYKWADVKWKEERFRL